MFTDWFSIVYCLVQYCLLTGSLLFLLELLLLLGVLRLGVKVVVGVLRQLPLVVLVHEVGRAAGQVNVELLNVDLHDAAVHCHPHLENRETVVG